MEKLGWQIISSVCLQYTLDKNLIMASSKMHKLLFTWLPLERVVHGGLAEISDSCCMLVGEGSD